MSVEPHLVFLNSETMGTPGSIERFVQSFEQCGYEVRNLRVGSTGKRIAESDWYDHRAEPVVAQAYTHQMLDFEVSRASDAQREIRFEVFVQLG